MIKSHLFRNKRFKFFFRHPKNKNHLGTCSSEDKEIEISPKLKGEELLDCVIHESIHACLPDIDDDAVDETSTSIAKLLVRLGIGEIEMQSKFVKKPQKSQGGMKGKPQNQGSEKNFTRISHSSKNIKKK
ncbi:MAG: hypothetical protein GF411_20505 [Candidatus Lokiarchaeota archaeon]|nr:hypothetical protein [Candidatus Lokiarchaeota archaeon]